MTETTYENMKRGNESNSSSNDRGREYYPNPYMLLYQKINYNGVYNEI